MSKKDKERVVEKKTEDLEQISKSIDSNISKLELQKQLLIEKGLQSKDPEVLMKANLLYTKQFEDTQRGSNGIVDRKSILIDPYQLYQTLGYRDKGQTTTYDTLRNMSKAPIVKSIIETRIEQAAYYGTPQTETRKPGWQIRRKRTLWDSGEIDKKRESQDKRIIEHITEFLLNGGSLGDNWGSDDFDVFLRKIIRDSLVLDQMTFEIVRDRRDIPVEFFATDGATYRFSDNYSKEGSERLFVKKGNIEYYPKYVQLIQGQVNADFYPWELCFGIRNHTTAIMANSYGRSELEDMIRLVTWMLYGDLYNGNFFSQGASPKGIMKLKGNVNDGRLAEFKQQWKAQVAGVQNSWKTPIIEADTMEWIDLQKSNQDMQFSHWQEYLIRLTCALYKIDPIEIGFQLGSSSGNSAMFEASQQVRIKYSQERGLAPLLRFTQRKLSKYLVSQLHSDFEFNFTGLDNEDEQKELDADIKKLNNFMGYKEIRKKYGLPEDIEEGDLILNGIYYQNKMAEMYSQQSSGYNQGGGEEEQTPPEEETEKGIDPIMEEFKGFIGKLVNEEK